MRTSHVLSATVALAFITLVSTMQTAHAAETCGNGIDDDSDGLADEGCFSNAVMGVCPSPLGCDLTGDVAPVTGAWVWCAPVS